jgi:hypothetical protein
LTGIVVCLGGYSSLVSALRIGRTVTATTSKLSGMAYKQLSNHSPKFIKRAFSPRHNADSVCAADDKHVVIELESPRRRTHRFDKLPMCEAMATTWPAEGVADTEIIFIEDGDIVPGQHTVLLRWWRDILILAGSLMDEGRVVYIDSAKRKDLLQAANVAESKWTKHDAFFKRLAKHRVIDILERVSSSKYKLDDEGEPTLELVHPELIEISTVHGGKGLQGSVVRVGRCVVNGAASGAPDGMACHYVALTRAQEKLYLPVKQPRKRSYWAR